MPRPSPDLTTPLQVVPHGSPTTGLPARPPVAIGTAPDPSVELLRLLRPRLRQIFLILLAVYAVFLLRDLIRPRPTMESRAQVYLLAAGLVAQGVVTAIAWCAPLGLRGFRLCEAIALGVAWCTEGANQYFGLTAPTLGALLDHSGSSDEVVLVASTWMLPWFALMAGYAVVVPNPWRRTAGIVGLTAGVPIVVTASAAGANPALTPPILFMLFLTYTIWGLIAGSIAVYAAFQAQTLRREAADARQFGAYRLLQPLGGGGMGDLFLAEHQLLRRPSVIKLIRPDRARDPQMIRRFEREVRKLAGLTHWNTVEVYDYGHTPDGTFYFVMEYLPGLNLDELVAKHGPLPAGRAIHVLRQVCAGLREAHAVGLIHRDVKPSNVILGRRGGLPDVAKLLDFGLVQDAAEDDDPEGKITREGAVVGTPAYLSPEQACGAPLDHRSDIYSLGATAYFLLTGSAPFVKSRVMEVIAAHIHELPRAPAGAPDDLAAVVLRCLAKSPAERYPDVRAVAEALAACSHARQWEESEATAWWAAREQSE